MTIQGTRTDIAWVDEIQKWSEFDIRWVNDAAARRVKDPYTQKLFDEMDARLLKQIETDNNLKALAAKYLPEDPSDVEWTPAPAPEIKTLSEMSNGDKALVKSIYWGYLHGADQKSKER